MDRFELFSVVILCYRSFDTIYEAIDSILMQDYPRIELVISDDASPNFPKDELKDYITRRKGKNLEKLIIRQETINCGTVKHLNHAFAACSGELIGGLAADDVFFDEHTLANYKRGFDNQPDCLLVMSQAGMYDERLEELQGYYFAPELIDIIREPNCGIKLFNEEARFPHLPTGATVYRKEFFEVAGLFDERFKIIEDIPMHLKITRENVPIHFENFISLKHRGGGISHGNSKGLKKSFLLYVRDAEQIYRLCIKPYRALLTPETRRYSARRDRAQTIFLDSLIASKGGLGAQFRFIIHHPFHVLFHFLRDFYYRFPYGIKKRLLFSFLFLIYLVLPYLQNAIRTTSPAISRILFAFTPYYRGVFSLCILCGLILYLFCMFLEELSKAPTLYFPEDTLK